MNTMKKEDIIKEKEQLTYAGWQETVRVLTPIARLLSAVTRELFLNEELRKVTPRPAPQPEPEKPTEHHSV